MQESQNRVIYQVSTIWFHGKDIQRKRIPGSQFQRSSTSESSSARSTRTILTSRPRLLLLSTPHPRWLDRQSSRLDLPNESEDDQPTALTNELKSELRLIFYRVFGWIRVTSKSDVLSRVARDCMWLSADRFSQNFYFSTFLSLSHKASVFLLELPLGQEVFHRQPSSYRFSSSISRHWVRRFFTNDMVFWDSSTSLRG